MRNKMFFLSRQCHRVLGHIVLQLKSPWWRNEVYVYNRWQKHYGRQLIDTTAILLLLCFHCVRDSKYLVLQDKHNTLESLRRRDSKFTPVSFIFSFFINNNSSFSEENHTDEVVFVLKSRVISTLCWSRASSCFDVQAGRRRALYFHRSGVCSTLSDR